MCGLDVAGKGVVKAWPLVLIWSPNLFDFFCCCFVGLVGGLS